MPNLAVTRCCGLFVSKLKTAVWPDWVNDCNHQSIFVQLVNCFCPNSWIYLSKLQNVFFQIAKCICEEAKDFSVTRQGFQRVQRQWAKYKLLHILFPLLLKMWEIQLMQWEKPSWKTREIPFIKWEKYDYNAGIPQSPKYKLFHTLSTLHVMQVVPPGGQIYNSVATWWQNYELNR